MSFIVCTEYITLHTACECEYLVPVGTSIDLQAQFKRAQPRWVGISDAASREWGLGMGFQVATGTKTLVPAVWPGRNETVGPIGETSLAKRSTGLT